GTVINFPVSLLSFMWILEFIVTFFIEICFIRASHNTKCKLSKNLRVINYPTAPHLIDTLRYSISSIRSILRLYNLRTLLFRPEGNGMDIDSIDFSRGAKEKSNTRITMEF